MMTSGASGAVRPRMRGVGAGVDDQHDEDGGHRLAHRRGERREAAGAHDPLPVALDRVGKERFLLGRRIGRAHQADAREPLGGERCKLTALVGAGAGMPADAPREHPEPDRERRHHDEAQQGQADRDAREDEQGGGKQEQVPDQRHHRGGDDALRLVGLVDERGDQQAGSGAVEETEIELQQVIVELAAQARDQALLHPGVEL